MALCGGNFRNIDARDMLLDNLFANLIFTYKNGNYILTIF